MRAALRGAALSDTSTGMTTRVSAIHHSWHATQRRRIWVFHVCPSLAARRAANSGARRVVRRGRAWRRRVGDQVCVLLAERAYRGVRSSRAGTVCEGRHGFAPLGVATMGRLMSNRCAIVAAISAPAPMPGASRPGALARDLVSRSAARVHSATAPRLRRRPGPALPRPRLALGPPCPGRASQKMRSCPAFTPELRGRMLRAVAIAGGPKRGVRAHVRLHGQHRCRRTHRGAAL